VKFGKEIERKRTRQCNHKTAPKNQKTESAKLKANLQLRLKAKKNNNICT